MMRRRMTLRIAGILALCLLAGSVFLGASTAGPPAGGPPAPPPPTPPPPPEPEPTPPPQPVYPCVIVAPLPPEMDTGLRAARSLADPPVFGSWIEAGPLYESGPFKIFINPEFQGINALLNFNQLQQGAYIGLLEASAPFRFEYKGGESCPPPPVGAARSLDDGTYLLSMAHAPTLGIPPPPEMIMLNWFVALVRVRIPFEPDLGAIIFYPDAKYRSPEEMLKAARSLDDGGILVPLPPKVD